jgi:hypothetical protein
MVSNPRLNYSIYGVIALAVLHALRKRRKRKKKAKAAMQDFAQAQAAFKKATAEGADAVLVLGPLKAKVESIKAASKMSEKELTPKPDPAAALWRMFAIVWPGKFAGRRVPTIDMTLDGSGYLLTMIAFAVIRTALHGVVSLPPLTLSQTRNTHASFKHWLTTSVKHSCWF